MLYRDFKVDSTVMYHRLAAPARPQAHIWIAYMYTLTLPWLRNLA